MQSYCLPSLFYFNNSIYNIRISAATADIPAHKLPDFVSRICMSLTDTGNRTHDLARGAITALKAIMLYKCLLHGMQFIAFRQSFYCCNLFTIIHNGEAQAGIYTPSIYMHRTGAALTMITTFLCTIKM